MSEFEQRLNECLEALREGRWDIEECLRRNPEHAAELRPHLLVAASLAQAYQVQPSAEFRAAARERFGIASGEHLVEAFDVDPSPSFFAAARVRFLATAQRMKLGERRPNRGWLPAVGVPFKALAGAGAALVMFLSFSTYTVASANNSLPGDWQYGVKLQTERVRLALALSEDARRDVQIDITNERVEEIEKLTAKGKVIGPGVLDRLADQTQDLVDDADDGKLDEGDLERLSAVTEKQKDVLLDAEDQIADDAEPKLAEALDVAQRGALVSVTQLSARKLDEPIVLPPAILLRTPEADDTPTATSTATAEASATPGSDPSPAPTATTPPIRTGVQVDPTPAGIEGGVTWSRLAVGRFTTLIPSPQDGWRIVGVTGTDGSGAAPSLVRLSNADGTSLITLNPRSGEMFWFVVNSNGSFDEVQMRVNRDGETFVADPAVIRALYGTLADVPLYVLENIVIGPAPTPTPPASPTPTASPFPVLP